MGCFDTVIFKCPKCDAVIEEQSKAGKCILRDYEADRVPIDIASDLNGVNICCDSCGSVYRISNNNSPRFVPLFLDKLEEDDDYENN